MTETNPFESPQTSSAPAPRKRRSLRTPVMFPSIRWTFPFYTLVFVWGMIGMAIGGMGHERLIGASVIAMVIDGSARLAALVRRRLSARRGAESAARVRSQSRPPGQAFRLLLYLAVAVGVWSCVSLVFGLVCYAQQKGGGILSSIPKWFAQEGVLAIHALLIPVAFWIVVLCNAVRRWRQEKAA